MEATIHLVRHGKVENPAGVIYGRLPGFHLSALGQKQARAAATHLAARRLGAVWSSPLERAQETAAAIAESHGLEVVTDDRLIESATSLQGTRRNLAAFLTIPRLWWSLRDPLQPSWGESYSDIKTRMIEVVQAAIATTDDEIVFVSHQTPVQAARKAFGRRSGPPWFRERCVTGSVSTLLLRDGVATASSYFEPGTR